MFSIFYFSVCKKFPIAVLELLVGFAFFQKKHCDIKNSEGTLCSNSHHTLKKLFTLTLFNSRLKLRSTKIDSHLLYFS